MTLLSAALLQAHVALAQGAEASLGPLVLRRTEQLAEEVPSDLRGRLPSFVWGDRIAGRPDLEVVAEGDARLRRGDIAISADRLQYDQPDDLATATGSVRVNQGGNIYEGQELQLKLETFEGYFNAVKYRLLANGGHGEAARVDFLSSTESVGRRASYTTCQREDVPGWKPAWLLTAASISTDTEENVGVATNARISFAGISTPPIPKISFPLSSARKSGLLVPTTSFTGSGGWEFTQPYYWNIAPNRDATFTPTLMSRRGLNLSSDFRYLERDYAGDVRLDLMGSDRLVDSRFKETRARELEALASGKIGVEELTPRPESRRRWGLWTSHDQAFDARALGLDSLTASVKVNRVSDDDYWRDFTVTQMPTLSQRQLGSHAAINWGAGDWSGFVRRSNTQTLQDRDSPIVPPYDEAPRVAANYMRQDWHGYDVTFSADVTRFTAKPLQRDDPGFDLNQQSQPDGERAYSIVSLSRPFVSPGAFLVPRVQLNASSYRYYLPQSQIPKVTIGDETFVNGVRYDPDSIYLFPTSSNRVLPTSSLDGGLIFERNVSVLGKSLTQTLEPRAFYTYTPYRDQSMLPNYDSAASDFSLASAYRENAFQGNDRVSDTHAITTGLTSRLIDPSNGTEIASYGIAQRYLLRPQWVTLPNTQPVARGSSDMLLGGQINWSPKWSVGATLQYNPHTHESDRNALNVRYRPSDDRELTLAYRYQAPSAAYRQAKELDPNTSAINDGSQSIDLGWRWPLGDGGSKGRWSAFGKLDYSLQDHQLAAGNIGLEYDGCCWIGRVMLQKSAIGQSAGSTRIMFQLELPGLSGSSRGRRSYGPSNPSRFSNYD